MSPQESTAAPSTFAYLAGLRNAKVLGAAVLSCGDIFTSLGPQVVARVRGLLTWLADTLDTATFGQEQGWTDKEVAVVFNSFMYCIQQRAKEADECLYQLLDAVH